MMTMITMPVMNSSALDLGLISKDFNVGSIDTDSLFNCVGAAITCDNDNTVNNNVAINNTNPPPDEPGTLTVSKVVECKESPPNGGVCAFAETSTNFPEPGDYKIAVTGEDGNAADPSSFPGSSTGTPVEVGPGGYSITELQASIGQFQNELQATSIITTTTATGDCTPNFNVNHVFIDATGTMTSGGSQDCTIENTLTISGGQVPDTLTG